MKKAAIYISHDLNGRPYGTFCINGENSLIDDELLKDIFDAIDRHLIKKINQIKENDAEQKTIVD